jgi:putative restriction endonuclease
MLTREAASLFAILRRPPDVPTLQFRYIPGGAEGGTQMRYWWVNHKGTHAEEIGGGYIWSPKTLKTGGSKPTYENLTKVIPGDLVLSYAFAAIQAVGIVQEPHRETPKPKYGAGARESWADQGWYVPITWTLLDEPYYPKPDLEALRPLMPAIYTPLDKNGKGTENSYLAEISPDLFQEVIRRAAVKNPDLTDAVAEELAAQEVIESTTDETKKKQLVDARIGQGIFKDRLMELEPACRVTGTDDRRLLIASHIKPWAVSSNKERLDGNNGLLLAPHVDRLFDRFWISFTDDGTLITAGPGVEKRLLQWGLKPGMQTPALRPKQCAYMAYHRERLHLEAEKGTWT